MRYVFYAFIAVTLGLVWMNNSSDGKHLRNRLTANHTPEWKGN